MAVARSPGTVVLIANLGTGVSDGIGVGHRGNIGEATVNGSAGTGLDGLLVLIARIAEVDVHVDEAGDKVLALGVDDLGALGGLDGLGDLDDLLAIDQDVANAVDVDLGIDDVSSLKQKCHCSLLQAAGTSRPYASGHQR